MRYKVVPPVRDVDTLADDAATLPIVPGSVEDCCTRLRDGTDLPSRDAARELLTFLEALGLVAETQRGFHRIRDPPDQEAIADAFEERVFGVRELLAALDDADGPLTAEEAFEEISDVVPQWERARVADWETVWQERVERLLEWAVAFGFATRIDDGYELA